MKLVVAAMLMLASPTAAPDLSDHGLSTGLVTAPRMKAEAIRQFDQGLKGIGSTAHVTHCAELRWAHPGKVQNVYGGRCTLSNDHESQVVMCADTAVGFFALEYDGDVSDFMDNCWG